MSPRHIPRSTFWNFPHNPHNLPVLGPTVISQCILALSFCGLLLTHPQTVARAQFVTNPLTLDASSALIINGIVEGDRCGVSVSGVGDMNGDDVDDFAVGAYHATVESGQVYLLFGRTGTSPWLRTLLTCPG